MVEYSGMSFAMFFAAEYTNMILQGISSFACVSGRLAHAIDHLLNWIPGWIWLGLRPLWSSPTLWVRSAFPRLLARPDRVYGLENLHTCHAGGWWSLGPGLQTLATSEMKMAPRFSLCAMRAARVAAPQPSDGCWS
jgi:hypothetical protein